MSQQVLVSAIVTSHNRRRYVCDAVDSVLAQTYPNVECVVIEDGSTDGSVELLREKYGDRIRLVVQEKSGVGAARNRGVAESRGELVGFLDDDDVWLPEKIAHQVALFDRYADTVLVGGATRYIDENGAEILEPTRADEVVTYEQLCIWAALPGMCSNELIKRDVFLAVGGFDPTLIRGQDRDLYIRIAARGAVRTVQVPTLLKRVHAQKRPGVDFERVKQARTTINSRIPDARLRRKAEAMLFFHLGRLRREEGSPVRAWGYFIASALRHPGRLDRRISRLRMAAEYYMPKPAFAALGRLRRALSGQNSPAHSAESTAAK